MQSCPLESDCIERVRFGSRATSHNGAMRQIPIFFPAGNDFNPYPANIFCPENVICFLLQLHTVKHV